VWLAGLKPAAEAHFVRLHEGIMALVNSRMVVLLLGALFAIRSAAAQRQPSQIELNGFLLGQHRQSLDRALGVPFQVDTQSDGWTDRVYAIDRAHHAYMAFKFAVQRPAYAVSIQVAGTPGTPMRPFLGLTLGATRADIIARLGPPSSVTPEPDLHLELLEYAGRNYSFEVDSTGVLSSIQILGYDGLLERPTSHEPDPLERFRTALTLGAVDSLMAVLAPDVEFYRGSQVETYQRAPRTELEDHASSIWRNLFADSTGLISAVRARPSDSAVRVQENGIVGLVYKYDAGPVRELFFTWIPGGYRLWEARFR
jgi:hypothetical protein